MHVSMGNDYANEWVMLGRMIVSYAAFLRLQAQLRSVSTGQCASRTT